MTILKTIARILFLSLLFVAPAAAQTYPDKPVRIIVPYAAGGITDILARALAQQLTERWGQQVIVENRPGGNSQIGAEYVARSAPDGYTLLVSADTTFVMAPHLYRDQKFDALTDFAPITGLGISPQALVVHPSVPVNSVADLIAYGHDHPGALNYGTFGIGSSGHLNIELIQIMTGAHFTPVHYGGATPAINDLLGGHIQFMIVSVGLVAQPWKAGLLKVLAIGSKERTQGISGYPDLGGERAKGLRGRLLVRPGRAQRHAARNHRQDQSGYRGRLQQSGVSTKDAGAELHLFDRLKPAGFCRHDAA